jgi:hypothetical protein
MTALLRATLLFALAGWAVVATAASALFTLEEIVQRSRYVFVAEVNDVAQPNWKDEQGSEIMLASVTVTRVLKGDTGNRVVIAYKANVDDQPQMRRGERYLIFSVGPATPLLHGHQVRALPVRGQEVSTFLIKGEPERQPLVSVEDRIRRLVEFR